ncbi:MAG TPA: GtrA family protein [Syntrophales bacterium]|nr:GtrA family protein [Syntrophales bacterium]
MTGFSLTAKYAFFAFVATGVNLATQYISLSIYPGVYSLYLAIVFGTLAGLALKYVLDREYIFHYRAENRVDDMTRFILYSLMGIFTTVIFWGVEIGFDALFETDSAKYVGAMIGLSIGYTTKYHLDKRFVFQRV